MSYAILLFDAGGANRHFKKGNFVVFTVQHYREEKVVFGFLKKKKEDREGLRQLQPAGGPCIIHLFFEKSVELPSGEDIAANLSRRLGEVECTEYSSAVASYAIKDYIAEFKEGKMPVMLSIMGCCSTDGFQLDELTRSQMWECPESERILAESKYHVVAVDMMGAGIADYKRRAHLLCEYAEALVELFPDCTAILFQNSGKMYTADDFRAIDVSEDVRFIKYAVTVRLFNIAGTGDQVVDSLGMGMLNLPDVQYHFHGMDPNEVVLHAYQTCSYNYDNHAPIKSGETIDGIRDGELAQDIQWKCRYEEALIQPIRPVMDINVGE